MEKNCAFQYYDGRIVKVDRFSLTLEEAKQLWNDNYEDMVNHVMDGDDIEVAIWINMANDSDYRETLIHLSSPSVKDGTLWEPMYYNKF